MDASVFSSDRAANRLARKIKKTPSTRPIQVLGLCGKENCKKATGSRSSPARKSCAARKPIGFTALVKTALKINLLTAKSNPATSERTNHIELSIGYCRVQRNVSSQG